MNANSLINKIKLAKFNNIDTSHDKADLIISFMDEEISHWDKSLEDECEFERRIFYKTIGEIPSDNIKAAVKLSEYIDSLSNKIRVLYMNSAWKALARYTGIMSVAGAKLLSVADRINKDGAYDEGGYNISEKPGFDEERHGVEAFKYWEECIKENSIYMKKSLKSGSFLDVVAASYNYWSINLLLAFIQPDSNI